MTGSDLDPMYASFRRTTRFAWDHLPSIVAVSLAWFLAALPLVTLGPATVGAYRALGSLREGGGIDPGAVLGTVREQFVHATLLSFVPLALAAIGANYAMAYLATGAVAAGLLALASGYAALYAGLVSIPTLMGLAEGTAVRTAVADGYRWTARHPVGAVALGVVTVLLFVASAVLTVAVAVAFAGVAFTLHLEFVDGVGGARTADRRGTDRPAAGRAVAEVSDP